MAQTFIQYLLAQILPPDIVVEKQIDKSYFNKLLKQVAEKYPDKFDYVLTHLKRLADHLSTMEAVTIGLDEISVPNKAKRDAIIKKYQATLERDKKSGNENVLISHLGELQDELIKNDLDGTKDDASVMVKSSLTGKKIQLVKMRTSPGVVADHKGSIVPEIFNKSYAEGVDPLHFWLGAVESRKNLAQGQVKTAEPGELNKVLANVLAGSVVSAEDCGTHNGIVLATRDDSVVDRYLARDYGIYKRNSLITPDVQQALLKQGVVNIYVRSPQTCEGKDGTVCQLCMGLRPGTGKKWEIGDNAGLITAGNIGEPMQQMVLSAKHSASKAEVFTELRGTDGFRQFMESPENYPNRKVISEVIGEVYRIHPAPQGGTIVTIRQTMPVPDRYIVLGIKHKESKGYIDYYIPPQLHVLEGVKAGVQVYPGTALSDGIDNMKDTARLKNLGFTRSVTSQNLYNIYKNSDLKMDRRHFELLSRASNTYVKIVKAPVGSGLLPGEMIKYQELADKVKALPLRSVPLSSALGKVLGESVLDLTVGTEIDTPTLKYLSDNSVKQVTVCDNLEVEAVATPLTRVVNHSDNWIAALNHRYIKNAIRDAASFNKATDIHSYNPISAYAYGAEIRHGASGTY